MTYPPSRAQSKRATLLKLLGDIESLEANLKVSSAPRTTKCFLQVAGRLRFYSIRAIGFDWLLIWTSPYHPMSCDQLLKDWTLLVYGVSVHNSFYFIVSRRFYICTQAAA